MILERFETLLHLFVLFNLAGAVTPEFIHTLNNRIATAYNYAKGELQTFGSKINVARESLLSVKDSGDSNIDSEELLTPIVKDFGDLEKKFSKLKADCEKRIAHSNIDDNGFKYICLYSALYCLVVLYLTGYCPECHHQSFSNALLLLNLESTLFAVYCILYERRIVFIFGLSFNRTIAIFILNLGIALFFYNTKNVDCIVGAVTLATFSVFVSCAHFIFYSINTLYIAYDNGIAMKKDLNNFDAEYKKFENGDYSGTVKFLELYKKNKKKPPPPSTDAPPQAKS